MIGVDANVLLRLFTTDNPEQTDATARLFDRCAANSVRVTNIGITEFVWTLGRYYKRGKPEIIAIVEQLLQREELVFENRGALMMALRWFEGGRADFADYLIAALNEDVGATPTYTFDRDAGDHPSFSLINPVSSR